MKSADPCFKQQQAQKHREVLSRSVQSPMTPTGLVSTTTASLPSNWLELAIKGRTAALREAQRNMSSPTTSPAKEAAVNNVAAPHSPLQSAAPQKVAQQAIPAVKTEPETEALPPTDARVDSATAAVASAAAPLAGGLVGAESSSAPHEAASPSSVSNDAFAPSASTQKGPIAALLSAPTPRAASTEEEALRTEVMGPPPSLPADPAYPPLNPVITDHVVHAPAPKRRGPNNSANGTQRKTAPVQAPADFEAPRNLNGKMPYALFQTIKKAPTTEQAKSTIDMQPSQSQQRYVNFSAIAFIFLDDLQPFDLLRSHGH